TLIKILVEAFESVEPIKYQLFKNLIYCQEVLKIKPINTKGKREKEVTVSKVKDAKKAEKEIKVTDKRTKKINLQ
ncbi:8684_t:CDS:2, partial [Funneliformis geosporum]